MNDPGLDDQIIESANEMSRETGHGNHDGKRAKKGYTSIRKTRWWMLSTASPLVVGTFGPIANLLSVCALVQKWRLLVPPGLSEADGQGLPDPQWVLVLNGISFACAIVANMYLLLNFARRVRYQIAQPITIILWYLSAILLLVPLALTHVLRIKPAATHAFSQAYYYAMISCALYMIISSLLLLNLLGSYYWRAYPPSFSTLTMAQRTLMLQTISYAFYLALGAGVFSSLEGWDFVDGIYWADYTLLTVGLGSDFPLMSTTSRGLLIPYAVGGIMMVGIIVSSVRGFVLERAVVRLERVRLEKERERWNVDHLSELSEPQKEYEVMREIEKRTETIRRYSALAMSLFTFITLWTLGALVFWYSEEPQGWTYFEALYFSYTTLLTIGYGDFYPASNAGKPFFVIWTLIAVPAMTILVANLGNTLVDILKFGTSIIARYTILPEKVATDDDEDEDEWMPLDTVMEQRHRALMIVRGIRRITSHLQEKPPRKYEWEEWEAYMSLCDETAMSEMWLADDGPMFSQAEEPKWLLKRLVRELEAVLEQELDADDYEGTAVSAKRSNSS